MSLSRYRLRPSTSLTDMKFDLAATHRAGRWLCPGGGGGVYSGIVWDKSGHRHSFNVYCVPGVSDFLGTMGPSDFPSLFIGVLLP